MKLLIDDANIERIKEICNYYPIDGVTTNPSILAKYGENPYKALAEIREFIGNRAELHAQVVSKTADEMVAEGLFLDALYYRLNVVELDIPPLRERREDILPLAEFYLQHFCEKYKLNKEFDPKVRECLLDYDWPGNVRELRNMVENLTVSSVGKHICMEDLPARIAGLSQERSKPNRRAVQNESLKSAVEALQKEMIAEAIAKEGSLRKAAAALDMDATTLGRLVKKLGVEP